MRGIPGHFRRQPSAPYPALSIALAILALGSSIASILLAPYHGGGDPAWRGYRVILIEAAIPEATVLAALAAGGIRPVISESTEPVLISNWVGLESTTLAAARHRLVGDDPRRDAYIEALPAWFIASVDGAAYRAYYLPAHGLGRSGPALRAALSSLPGRWLLPEETEGQSMARGPRFLVFAVSAALLLAASLFSSLQTPRRGTGIRFSFARRPLELRLALAAPWALLGASGLPTAPVAALFGLALVDAASALDLPLEELRLTRSWASALDSLGRRPELPLSIASCALAALFFEPAVAASAGLAALGSLFSALALSLLRLPHAREGGRPRFVPKPIARPKPSLKPPSVRIAGLACALLALWGLSSLALRQGKDVPLGTATFPRPLRLSGSLRPDPAEAGRRRALASVGSLPDLADWLAHVAIQEALPLERIGAERGDPFEPVSISRPGGDAALLLFDKTWAADAYRKLPTESIEGMLASQPSATGAAHRDGGGTGRPLAPIDGLRYIVLLVPLLGGIAASLSVSRGASTSGTRQEA